MDALNQTSAGPVDNRDVEEWKSRFNQALAQSSDVLNSRSPDNAQPWHAGLFDCFQPIDLCLISCCLPCVTFGKTHHRLRKDPSLNGYEPINTSCLLFCGASCIGVPCIPAAMQRADIREKYNLEGSCIGDLAISWCCNCCNLIQQDKEVCAHHDRKSGVQTTPYKSEPSMSIPEST